MSKHRTGEAHHFERQSFARPHSNFDYVEREFGGNKAIRRLFSLARHHDAKYFIVEDIAPEGIVEDENSEIKSYFHLYEPC